MRLVLFAVIVLCILVSFKSEACEVKPLVVITKQCGDYVLAFGSGTAGEVEGYLDTFSPEKAAILNSILAEVSGGHGTLQILQSPLVCVND